MARLKLILFYFLFVSQYCWLQAQENMEKDLWLPCKDSTGKWSFRSVEGEHLKGLYFDSVTEFSNGEYYRDRNFFVAQVMNKNRWGVINSDGKFIVPVEYKTLTLFFPETDDGWIEATKIAENGKEIKDHFNFYGARIDLSKYCSCELSRANNDWLHVVDHYFTYTHMDGWRTFHCFYDKEKSKMEVVSMTGKTLIDTSIVRSASYYTPGAYSVNNERILKNEIMKSAWVEYDQAMRIISSKDEFFLLKGKDTIVPPGMYSVIEKMYEYYPSNNMKNPVLKVQQNGLWGLIDGTGKILIEPQFEKEISFRNGVGGKGYISGKVVLFDTLFHRLDFGKYEADQLVLYENYSNPPKIATDFFLFRSPNEKFGVINKDQEVLIQPLWSQIHMMGNSEKFYFRAENAGPENSKLNAVAFYNSAGELMVERKNVPYERTTMNHCWMFNDKKNAMIFNALTGKIIRKKIKASTISLKTHYNIETDENSIYNFAGVYLNGKGWEVIDNNGKILIPAKHPECNSMELIVRSDTLWGCAYSTAGKDGTKEEFKRAQSSIEMKDRVIIPFQSGNAAYNERAGFLFLYKDSIITYYSLDGQVLKSENLSEEYSDYWIFATSPDTIYCHYAKSTSNFYDANLKPLLSEGFKIELDQNRREDVRTNLIGKAWKDKKQSLIIFKDSIFVSRFYDEVIYNPYYAIGKYGELTDLYAQNGDLIFAACEKFQDHDTYCTFEKAQKKYWTNKAYKIYMVTNL